MTFSDIYNDVLNARFKSSQTTQIKRWINLREAQLWARADWPWKKVSPTNLTVTASDSTPTLPSDIAFPLDVYDDDGDKLVYMEEGLFGRYFMSGIIDGTTETPWAYKWNNGVLTLGPTPAANATYKVEYIRKPSHYDTNGAVVVGPMSADTDYPLFDAEWHQVLVMGAIATGLKVENDPTWEALEQEYQAIVQTMADHYLPTVSVAGNMQYGADNL